MRIGRSLGNEGVFHFPLLISLLILTTTGFGIWGMMRNWSSQVETQLRLNQCVGEAALELRDRLNRLSQANKAIHQTRVLIAAALISQPETVPALRLVLKGLSAEQDRQLSLWSARQVKWSIQLGCGSRDIAFPLPLLPLFRPPIDPIGHSPLQWKGETLHSFTVRLVHLPRASVAEVKGGSLEVQLEKEEWKASWRAP